MENFRFGLVKVGEISRGPAGQSSRAGIEWKQVRVCARAHVYSPVGNDYYILYISYTICRYFYNVWCVLLLYEICQKIINVINEDLLEKKKMLYIFIYIFFYIYMFLFTVLYFCNGPDERFLKRKKKKTAILSIVIQRYCSFRCSKSWFSSTLSVLDLVRRSSIIITPFNFGLDEQNMNDLENWTKSADERIQIIGATIELFLM